jgi:hypothetical protein
MKEQKQYAFTDTDYNVMHHQQAITVDKAAKRKENVTLYGVPKPEHFPGGTDWRNEKGETLENPFWRMAVNYALYYEFGQRRRDGEREFEMLHAPEAGERGAPQMKSSTATRKLVEAWQREGRSAAWIEKMLASMATPE